MEIFHLWNNNNKVLVFSLTKCSMVFWDFIWYSLALCIVKLFSKTKKLRPRWVFLVSYLFVFNFFLSNVFWFCGTLTVATVIHNEYKFEEPSAFCILTLCPLLVLSGIWSTRWRILLEHCIHRVVLASIWMISNL